MDPLTGLPGREALDDAFAQLRDTGYSLLFIDLDGLKEVNDHQGHLAGDDYIRRAAKAMVGAVRSSDPVVRYGGDEFVIVLPAQGNALAATVARAVTAAVKAVGVAASIGVATAKPGDEPGVVLGRADRAMYRHKGQRVERRDLLRAVGETAQALMGEGRPGPAEPSELPEVQRLVERLLGPTAIPLDIRSTWYEVFPDGLRVLRRERRLTGLFHYLPLQPSAIDRLRDRLLAEMDISQGDVAPGSTEAHVIVLAAADPQEGAALLLSALRELASYRRITALTDTEAGSGLCRRLGFGEIWRRGAQRFFELRVAR